MMYTYRTLASRHHLQVFAVFVVSTVLAQQQQSNKLGKSMVFVCARLEHYHRPPIFSRLSVANVQIILPFI
jgi:hypothetical protein